MILFINWGVQRGKAPSARGLGGVPPNLKVPQDWGIKGVEKAFVNALATCILHAIAYRSRIQPGRDEIRSQT